MPFTIRPYQPRDLRALYTICLKTGDSGADASPHFRDPDLLGHYYAAPYGVLAPETSFVLVDEQDEPCGYILGARDTAEFAARCEIEWFPALRARYPLPPPNDDSPDAQIIRAIHAGIAVDEVAREYPAHLHIDILPVAQKQGWGRRLMETFLARLRELGASGVHLGVSARNLNAIAFYEHLGFCRLRGDPSVILYGMRL
ncbi:MAG: GNAT family N-acetyltransferase [Thermoflexales bacterium]|nr:GNAT family N-acetyltransferase [Thermoflexales bacterium]MDW8352480.1 GNAT family N-acetyltransferase [Anaerolineae bacterium]